MVPAVPIVMLVDGFDPNSGAKSRPQLWHDEALRSFSPLFIEGKTGQSLRGCTACFGSFFEMAPCWVNLSQKREDFEPGTT